jgi:hypothetical protein
MVMTKPHSGWLLGLVAAIAALGACDADEAAELTDTGVREIDENGFRLNGFRLNGFRLNGFRLNGALLSGDAGDGIELQEIRLKHAKGLGAQVETSWLVGSDLHVKTGAGDVLSGPQLKGAELVFLVEEQGKWSMQTVRIGKVEPLTPGSDVWLYDLKIRAEKGPWRPLCVDHQGASTEAILLAGVWDPATGDRVTPEPSQAVTFACRDAALAKCVEWGYRPWDSVDDVSLVDHHQACTRASRADYCGDGVPHTLAGIEIHVLDELGIQADAGEGYVVEAEWGPDGAVCLNPANTRLPHPSLACDLPPCGASFASGALIQTGKSVP